MPPKLVSLGRVFYALGLIGIGVQHFFFRGFIPVIVPYWPSGLPGRTFCAYAVGAALLLTGLAILRKFEVGGTAAIAGTAFLLLTVFVHVPVQLAGSPLRIAVWSNAFKLLALAGGAWAVAESFHEPSRLPPILERVMPAGRYFLPITMVVFGIEHFIYPTFVATLVPAWIPWHLFWAYFAGVALIAAGLAMISGVQARLAALLLGIMIFLWFVFLHIPRAIADPRSGMGNEWTSVFEALAFSGIAFLLAALPPSKPAPLSSLPRD